MEMREVEAFLAVAHESHFGRAARRLHVSTAHVSNTIRVLERRIGGQLFARTSRRVALTPLGEQLLTDFRPAYQRLVQGLADAQRATARQRGHATLAIGFSTTLPTTTAAWLGDAFQRHTQCHIARSDLAVSTIMRRIEAAEFGVDVVVSWMPESFRLNPGERLRAGPPIGTAPRGVLLTRRHPLATRTTIDIEELADYDLHHPGIAPSFADAWTPAQTPAGKPLRRILSGHPASAADMRELLGSHVAHLTNVTTPPAWADDQLITIPLTGLPPIVCATLWPAADRNPLIPEFATIAAHTGLPEN